VVGFGRSRRLCSAEPRPVTPTGSGHESKSWRMVAERPFSRSTARTVHRIAQGSAGVGERLLLAFGGLWRPWISSLAGTGAARGTRAADRPGGGKEALGLCARASFSRTSRVTTVCPTSRPEARLAFRKFTRWLYRGGRPNALARAMIRASAAVFALGIAPDYTSSPWWYRGAARGAPSPSR
jgi:hypothetical protein